MLDIFITPAKKKWGGEYRPASLFPTFYCGPQIRRSRGGGDATMIITMGAVRVVQVSLHQVIRMISVRYAIMTATGPVRMGLWMAIAVVVRCASRRIRRANRQHMVVDVIAVDVVQMPVVQVVGVIPMPDRLMTTARSMLVVVPLVHGTVVLWHFNAPV
jgi:hypothetical protein